MAEDNQEIPFWKRNPNEYFLVELIRDTGTRYAIWKATPELRGVVRIEDNETYHRIVSQMIEDGFPITSEEEFKKKHLRSYNNL